MTVGGLGVQFAMFSPTHLAAARVDSSAPARSSYTLMVAGSRSARCCPRNRWTLLGSGRQHRLDRRPGRSRRRAGLLRGQGCGGEPDQSARGGTATLGCDVTKEDQVDNLVAEIVRAFARIDVIVNNASVYRSGKRLHEFDAADLDFCYSGTCARDAFSTVMWSAALSNPVLLGRSRQKELAGILANRSIGWDTASVRRTGRGTASSVAQGAGGDRLHVRPAVHQGLEKPPIQFLSIFNRRHPQCLGVALRAEPVANPRERRACPSPHGGGRVEADRRPAPPAPRTECIRRPAAGRWMWRSRTRAGRRTSVGPRRAKPVPLLVAQGELGDHLDVL
jgi:hypothetical protein